LACAGWRVASSQLARSKDLYNSGLVKLLESLRLDLRVGVMDRGAFRGEEKLERKLRSGSVLQTFMNLGRNPTTGSGRSQAHSQAAGASRSSTSNASATRPNRSLPRSGSAWLQKKIRRSRIVRSSSAFRNFGPGGSRASPLTAASSHWPTQCNCPCHCHCGNRQHAK
jgi:hypothetical protein